MSWNIIPAVAKNKIKNISYQAKVKMKKKEKETSEEDFLEIGNGSQTKHEFKASRVGFLV